MALIECIPNFSEGRDAALIDALVAAALSASGVVLLDRTMDADHHRSVLTLAGPPPAVAEGVVRAAGEAVRRIDLNQHRGVHPRLGAADVIPFVPLRNATMEECVHWAEWTGEELWRRYRLPVYLYEEAARRPERRRLETIRRGGFEKRREAMALHPEFWPDIGDPALHSTAGAVAVGARYFLIAFNIDLDTPNLAVAQAIARAIRSSSGGLPALKALGLYLQTRGCTQVSMNLTDFRQTSPLQAWEAVEREAAKLGAQPVAGELIGLAPQAALPPDPARQLRLRMFHPQMILENRLAAAGASEAEIA